MTEAPKPISETTANAAGLPASADSGAMPPAVARAVNAVMAEVPKLERSGWNDHGKYKFATIDDFLEGVRPLLAKHGLIISQDEESFELRQTQNKKGDPVTWLVVTFRYTLVHSSGETWGCRPSRTIMVNASAGPQSFGAAQSYSLKQYMRSLFQVATGEPDLDTDGSTGGSTTGSTESTKRPPFNQDRAEDKMADRAVNLMLGKGRAKVFALIDQFGEEVYQTENVDDYAERLTVLLEKMPALDELKQLWENNVSQVGSLPDSRAADVTGFYDFRRTKLAGELPQTPLEAG